MERERENYIIWAFSTFSLQVQSTSWMPHQQYVMQPTVSTINLHMDRADNMA